jgi:hypothetical protein
MGGGGVGSQTENTLTLKISKYNLIDTATLPSCSLAYVGIFEPTFNGKHEMQLADDELATLLHMLQRGVYPK